MTSLTKEQKQSINSNELFNNRWQLYQKILNHNYMEHREIYGILNQLLSNYFQKPFSVLELGCGDASFTIQALLNTNIVAYTGIDLSQDALAIAQDNMALTPYSKHFLQGNFSEIVAQLMQSQEHSFDVALTSFAFHHLNLEQKEQVISELSHLLNPNGVFIIIDMICSEGESQEAYIQRYLENVRQNWSQLTSQEVDMVGNHICNEDLPETQNTLYSIAQKHNFTRCECLYRDPQDISQLLCFYK